MKIKVTLCLSIAFLFFILSGWKCSSSKNLHKKNQSEQSVSQKTDSSSGIISPDVSSSATASADSAQSLSTSSSSAPSSAATITISTSNATPLNKDLHSACVADIFFGKGREARDILGDPYFSFVKSFNFTSLQYSGGSTADHDHAIIGDTRITGGKGDGYNIRAEDCTTRGENINSILDGVGTIHFGVDFFNEYCSMLNKLSIPGDLIANVQSGTLEELFWKIEQSHARRVVFGLEQNLPSNTFDFPDGNAYRNKITHWIEAVKQKYPNVITVVDAAPVFRPNARFTQWNDAVKNMPADEVRMYLWDKDVVQWQPDQQQNLTGMNQVFTTVFPEWLSQMQQKFPGKKCSVWQWGLKPPKTELYNTMAACIYIAKFYKFMIDYNKANDNYIAFASFMSLKSLNRGDGEILNHAAALQLCGKLFTGNKRVVDLNVEGLNGVSGVAFDDPARGTYALLLINETGSEISIPNISINQKAIEGKKFTITSLSASSLGSMSVSSETKTYSSLLLHPYSVSVVEF